MIASQGLQEDCRLHRETRILLVIAESGGWGDKGGASERLVGNRTDGVQIRTERHRCSLIEGFHPKVDNIPILGLDH